MTNFLKQIQQLIKSLGNAYNKSSVWGQLLILISFLFIVVLVFKGFKRPQESFEQNDKLVVKTGKEVYDSFYADIYDYLVFNNIKDEYELNEIINKTSPTEKSKILDIGCGTGHHVDQLASKGYDVIGIDISSSMIEKSKEVYPKNKYLVGDAQNSSLFESNSFTHIITMYFTIYYFQDKSLYFENCYKWLIPGGYLIVHLVDRNNFDPILPPGNPLLWVSPQKYAKERITTTKVKFTDFSYSADFKLDEDNNIAKFEERFKDDNTGKVRKNEQILYMESIDEIANIALSTGFILEGKIDLLQCQYEYQYLYIFLKPT
jgi:ubiquinone/menaquinone biosynthesis C-methylase UbiE